MFAITGQVEEAVTVARTLLPPDLAAAITPYLRYMPRLTRAQQAAAANLGAFPRASDIGIDDPRIVAYVAGAGGATGQQLVPAGEALGHRAERSARREPKPLTRAERAAALAARTAPPDTVPVRIDSPAVATTAAPAPVRASAPLPTPAPAPTSAPQTRTPAPAPSAYGPPNLAVDGGPPTRSLPPSAPLAAAPATAAPVSPPARTPVPARKPPPSLADAFSDLGSPTVAAVPRAGAVDIARLARRTPPKPPPPTHPSRIWVQLGTGRDRDALASDWRRFVREGGSAFRNRAPFISEWGARDRLLTGPFGSEAEAKAFIQQLAKSNYYGPFIWVSPAGQVVDSLDDD